VIKKLQKRLKKFLDSSEHVRTASLVGLLLLTTAIPLTVYVVQMQQDILQHAAGGGFASVDTNACGEAVSTPAAGANEGDISWKAPVRENGQWVTHKADGGTKTQDDMRSKYIADTRNGGTSASRATEWDTNVVGADHINCNVFINYNGIDCDRTPTSGFEDRVDSTGQPYKAVLQGTTAVLHVIAGTDVSSAGCRYNFKVRADAATTPTATPITQPTATPTSGLPPTPSALPTDDPNDTPPPDPHPSTVTPTPTHVPTVTPTNGPTSTPTIPKTPTIFSLTVAFPGIGQKGNTNPNNATRNVVFQLFDKNNQKVGSDVLGHLSFDTGSGTFKGEINVGTIVPSGSYSTKNTSESISRKVCVKQQCGNCRSDQYLATSAFSFR
jgi:hypothetical protein